MKYHTRHYRSFCGQLNDDVRSGQKGQGHVCMMVTCLLWILLLYLNAYLALIGTVAFWAWHSNLCKTWWICRIMWYSLADVFAWFVFKDESKLLFTVLHISLVSNYNESASHVMFMCICCIWLFVGLVFIYLIECGSLSEDLLKHLGRLLKVRSAIIVDRKTINPL